MIGRANDSTLVLTDDYASTRHARLSQPRRRLVRRGSRLHQRHLPRPYEGLQPVADPARSPRSGSARRCSSCGHDVPPAQVAPLTVALRYAVRSDRGLMRANNEDSVYAGPRLLALADGMGGHAAGEVASNVVISTLAPLDEDAAGRRPLSTLRRRHRGREQQPAGDGRAGPEPRRHGHDADGAAVRRHPARAWCTSATPGPTWSAAGELTQITHDDTFVQTLIDEGRLTEEEASSHPQRSLILHALNGAEVEPDLSVREARIGDRYLVCSDGLSDVVSPETHAGGAAAAGPARVAPTGWSSWPCGPAVRDNVTCIVADIDRRAVRRTTPR